MPSTVTTGRWTSRADCEGTPSTGTDVSLDDGHNLKLAMRAGTAATRYRGMRQHRRKRVLDVTYSCHALFPYQRATPARYRPIRLRAKRAGSHLSQGLV